MTSFAALLVLLHRYTGEEDICIGTQVAGRDDVAFENMVGTFVNTIPLRADLSGNPDFSTCSSAPARRRHGGPRVASRSTRKSRRNHQPQARFHEEQPFLGQLYLSNVRSSRTRRTEASSWSTFPRARPAPIYELNFFMVERAGGLARLVRIRLRRLFRSETVETMIARFAFLADAARRRSDAKDFRRPLMGVEDAHEVLARRPRIASFRGDD